MSNATATATATATIAIAPLGYPKPMVSKARKGLINFIKAKDGKVEELQQAYADALCSAFNTENTPWYELKGKLGKAVKAERAEFVAEMKAAGYDNVGTINVYWARIKAKSGHVPTPTNKVTATKDTDAEVMKLVASALNKIYAAEDADTDCKASKFKGQLLEAFAGLGGDIMELG